MSLNASFSRPLSALSLLGVLASPSLASAQAPAEAPAASPASAEAMADARFKAGLKAYDREDYDAARLEFLQAQAIFPRPALLRNLALSELHTGRPLDALQHLRTFLADPGTTPDKRALAERSLGEAYAQTGHLSVTAPAGAMVMVDGKEVGVAPLKEAVDVVVGLHGVDTKVGGTSLHESVQAGPGKLTEVAFVQPVVGETRVVGIPAPAPVAAPVAPVRHAPLEVVDPDPYWSGRRTVGVVIAGVGLVGVGLGTYFAFDRASDTTRANNALAQIPSSNPSTCYAPSAANASACGTLANARNDNSSDSHVQQTLFIAGGVLVAVGLVTTLWPHVPESPLGSLAPMTGPHVAGLQWGGGF